MTNATDSDLKRRTFLAAAAAGAAVTAAGVAVPAIARAASSGIAARAAGPTAADWAALAKDLSGTLVRPGDRVTEEDAAVRIIDQSSPILSAPNRIGGGDWQGWVQERSLYMPRTHDERYRTMLSMNDTGEQPNDGAILVAPLGAGTYVYTTLSLFRQLPAGVPGGARLFVNLLSADQRAAGTPSAPPKP